MSRFVEVEKQRHKGLDKFEGSNVRDVRVIKSSKRQRFKEKVIK